MSMLLPSKMREAMPPLAALRSLSNSRSPSLPNASPCTDTGIEALRSLALALSAISFFDTYCPAVAKPSVSSTTIEARSIIILSSSAQSEVQKGGSVRTSWKSGSVASKSKELPTTSQIINHIMAMPRPQLAATMLMTCHTPEQMLYCSCECSTHRQQRTLRVRHVSACLRSYQHMLLKRQSETFEREARGCQAKNACNASTGHVYLRPREQDA